MLTNSQPFVPRDRYSLQEKGISKEIQVDLYRRGRERVEQDLWKGRCIGC